MDATTSDAGRIDDHWVEHHIAFGAGPHRGAGSKLARMNLRIAVEELVSRLDDIALEEAPSIDFHSTFNRAPLSVPITFVPRRS